MTEQLTWLNHAGFLLSDGDVTLAVDPWLSGTAFDDGWALLVPSDPPSDLWRRVTHLWISHEHPDHLHIPTLRSIPADDRRRIVVLFHGSRDHRVADYLRGQSFREVIELDPDDRFKATDWTFRCMPFGASGDSLLCVQLPSGRTILNLNYCRVLDSAEADDLRSRLGLAPGDVDLLLTQFSYANWEGNPNDVTRRADAAAERLRRVMYQVESFRPRSTCLFASFIRFCHEENRFMNDEITRPKHPLDMVAKTGTKPVMFLPGDTVPVAAISEWDPERAAARYEEAIADVSGRDALSSPSVPLEELTTMGREAVRRAREFHGDLQSRFLGRVIGALTFEITDHNQTLSLDFAAGTFDVGSAGNPDISLSSSALRFALANDFGFNTLLVNGRFRVHSESAEQKLSRLSQLFDMVRTNQSVLHAAATVGRRRARRLFSATKRRFRSL